MLISCPYCGRIHDKRFNCGRRPVYKRRTDASDFRNTTLWQHKRAEIMERDLYLCRMSLYQGDIVYTDLSVHHIEPIEERPDLELEDSNLITLTDTQHQLAEDGQISRQLLHYLASTPPSLANAKMGIVSTPTTSP
jgi:5-methylcytosine-specific restriction protein A